MINLKVGETAELNMYEHIDYSYNKSNTMVSFEVNTEKNKEDLKKDTFDNYLNSGFYCTEFIKSENSITYKGSFPNLDSNEID